MLSPCASDCPRAPCASHAQLLVGGWHFLIVYSRCLEWLDAEFFTSPAITLSITNVSHMSDVFTTRSSNNEYGVSSWYQWGRQRDETMTSSDVYILRCKTSFCESTLVPGDSAIQSHTFHIKIRHQWQPTLHYDQSWLPLKGRLAQSGYLHTVGETAINSLQLHSHTPIIKPVWP